jgi:hypothetical protein
MEQSAPFDPYLMWLGIRHPERPPNHYRLLGLELFETDLDVIATAADRQMAHVRRFQNGDRSQLSQQILNELAAARVCLLRPLDKHVYDTILHDAMALQGLETRAGIVRDADRSDSKIPVWVRLQREAYWRRRGIQALVATMAVAVVGMTYLALQIRDSQQESRANQDVPVRMDSDPSAASSNRADGAPGAAATEPPAMISEEKSPSANLAEDNTPQPSDTADPMTQTTDVPLPAANEKHAPSSVHQGAKKRQKQSEAPAAPPPTDPSTGTSPPSAFDASPSSQPLAHPQGPERTPEILVAGKNGATTYTRLRAAIENRNLDVAWEEWRTLRANANSFEQKDGVDRIRVLLFQLERFWKAVDDGLAMLKTGMTLQIQNQPMKIVAMDSERVVVEFGGTTQTMDRDHHKMDANFACLMVTLHISAQGGAAQPLVAAFLEVDAKSDKDAAKQLRQDTSYRGFHSL